MSSLSIYFKIADYIAIGTFFVILIEFLYSYYKKDGVYSLKGTISNVLNGLVMKFLLENIGVISYISYLVVVKNKLPNFENLEGYGFFSLLLCLLVVDFTFYWYHRAQHYYSGLWALHFIHHSDDKLNTSTAYRFSLIEKTFNLTITIPAILLGFDPYFAILCFYITSIYGFFTHSVYLKFPSFLGYILVTPQIHSVHHDQNFSKLGMNFGIVFSIWDRMFDTYQDFSKNAEFGIKGYQQDNFIKIQTDPLVDYFKKIYKKYANRS